MLSRIGRKEKLSVIRGSGIEVSSESENEFGTGNVWFCAILEENIAESKDLRFPVRYLDPLLKEDYEPPMVHTTLYRSIRPVPPEDFFPDVGFEEGDVIDAVHNGGWWCGLVIKVLENQRYLVYRKYDSDVFEVGRKDLRPHMVWKDEEWFRCERQQMVESDFSVGKSVEVRLEVNKMGDFWTPAIVIKENEDGTLLVKLKSLSNEEDMSTKISVPYSEIRPSQPEFGYRSYKLMEKVDALIESTWCPGSVSEVLFGNQYGVVLGPNKESKNFDHYQLRPSIEWKDGVWLTEEKVLDSEDSVYEGKISTSTRIRVTIPTALRDQKNALATGKEVRRTQSSGGGAMKNSPPTSSIGVVDAETCKASVTESETLFPDTAANLTRELGSTRQLEIETTEEFHPPVLGIAATLTKPVVETQRRTSMRKKLQAMKNQKGSANDSDAEKGPEETTIREIVYKKKRGRPGKFMSTCTEPKQKSGVADNGSKAATVELANMSDDDMPIASWIQRENTSSGQSVCRSPEPMLNSVVEKHVDVEKTPPTRESTMALPFAKTSPIWKVLESMEVFKAVSQQPHFTPLQESVEESREGEAIGQMVMYTGLLEKLNNLQVDEPISSIIRIDECLLKLEKHGFNVTELRSRIAKLLSIKEAQAKALEESKAAEEKISENDRKRRKYEEDIVELKIELQRREAMLKEAKVRLDKEIAQKVRIDKEIAQMQSNAAVLDQKVKNVDEELRAIVTAPW